jgi:hypothetical protein
MESPRVKRKKMPWSDKYIKRRLRNALRVIREITHERTTLSEEEIRKIFIIATWHCFRHFDCVFHTKRRNRVKRKPIG